MFRDTFLYLLLLFGFRTFTDIPKVTNAKCNIHDGLAWISSRVSLPGSISPRNFSQRDYFCHVELLILFANGKQRQRDVLGTRIKVFGFMHARLLVTAGRRCWEFHRRSLTWSYRIYDVARSARCT